MPKSKDGGSGANARSGDAMLRAKQGASRKGRTTSGQRATRRKTRATFETEADLAALLTSFGFNLFSAADSAADSARWLGHAVREFQIYASMDNVAREKAGATSQRWLDRLEAVVNAARYTGPKNGDPKASGMDACLAAWQTNRYRCPVVVDAFHEEGGKGLRALDPIAAGGWLGNYWRYDDPRITKFLKSDRKRAARIRIRVCDLTGFFTSVQGTQPEDMAAAGAVSYLANGWFGGVTFGSGPDHEVLPLTLAGKAWAALNTAERKTFRVIRTVSEQECRGYFDAVNAYDDATFSFGPCHWALAPYGSARPKPDKAARAGETAPYLAYWSGVEGADAAKWLAGPFGVKFKPAWPTGTAGPKGSWTTTRNYVGRIDWTPEDSTPGDPGKRLIGDLDWLRTTHWFWRLLAHSRHVTSFRRRQWDMARLRLRDILAFEIDPKDRPKATPGANKVKLEKIFTSEAAVALLMRCHVRYSGFLNRNDFGGPSVRLALAFAALPGAPSTWGDAHEAQLVNGMLAAVSFSGLTAADRKAISGGKLPIETYRDLLATLTVTGGGLYSDCRAIAEWPRKASFQWNTAKPGKYALEAAACDPLSRARNSFTLEASGLPPMPN